MTDVAASKSSATAGLTLPLQPEGTKLTPGQATIVKGPDGHACIKYLVPQDVLKGGEAGLFATVRLIYPQYAECSDAELKKTLGSPVFTPTLMAWGNASVNKHGVRFPLPADAPPPALDKGTKPKAPDAAVATAAPKLPTSGATKKKEWVEVDGYNGTKDKYFVISNADGTKTVKDVGVYKAGDPRLDIGESDHIDPKLAQEDAFVRLAQKMYGINPGQAYALLKTDAAFKAAHDKFMTGGDVKMPAKVDPPTAKPVKTDAPTTHTLKSAAPLAVGGAQYTFEKGDKPGTQKMWITAQAPLGYVATNPAHKQDFKAKLAGDFYRFMAKAYGLSTEQINWLVKHDPVVGKALAQFTSITDSGLTPDGKHHGWVTLPDQLDVPPK